MFVCLYDDCGGMMALWFGVNGNEYIHIYIYDMRVNDGASTTMGMVMIRCMRYDMCDW